MAININIFKERLEKLVEQGQLLEYAMQRKIITPETFDAQVEGKIGKDKAKNFLKKIPNFNESYEPWYSECIALLRQLLPDRLANFVSLYEKPKVRKAIENGNYVIQDFLQGLIVTRAGDVIVAMSAALPQFRQQFAILRAAEVRFDSALFEMRQLVQADLFDTEIEAAHELLRNKFLRAAGAIAGVVLEKHVHQICEDRSIEISKKNPSISDLNDLLKTNSVVNIPQWRHISFLADIRNICDHNKKIEPTSDQIKDLLDGVNKVMKTIA